LARIEATLREEASRKDSLWNGTDFVFTGTTAGIRDLRSVISADYWRITGLVTFVVFSVIVVVLRRPGICLYLIASVLFSYLVTIGVTELYFFIDCTAPPLSAWIGKSPIFLFVILVAVGEDYNIYLVTRVLEEQKQRGFLDGLREAIIRTGGIITSCGVIMAGSFVSMISGSMRGVGELGFALTLGILLDTLVVRTLLVPAFLAWRGEGAGEGQRAKGQRDKVVSGGVGGARGNAVKSFSRPRPRRRRRPRRR
jgi:RND superfamily putative drug exporter